MPVPVICCFSISGFPHIKSAPKIREKSDKISVREPSGITWMGPEGHHQGPRRPGGAAQGVAAPRGRLGPWCPLAAPFAYIFPVMRNPRHQKPFSNLLFVLSLPFQDRAARRHCPSTLPEGGFTSRSPSISMDASRMCRE